MLWLRKMGICLSLYAPFVESNCKCTYQEPDMTSNNDGNKVYSKYEALKYTTGYSKTINNFSPNEGANCPATVTKYYTASTIKEQNAHSGQITAYEPNAWSFTIDFS